jgi:glutaredoxin 3
MTVTNRIVLPEESLAEVEIYTTPFCGFCAAAKSLLTKKGVEFTEIDVMFNPSRRPEMLDRSGGHHTVPQIFIGGKHVGGCDELYALDQAGDLDPLLNGSAGAA